MAEFKKRQNEIKGQKVLMLGKEVEVNVELEEATRLQQDCEKKFRAVVPQFIKANDDLQKITKKQIEELQAIRKPSRTILNLAKAVCIILQVEPVEVKVKENNFASTHSYWDAFKSS